MKNVEPDTMKPSSCGCPSYPAYVGEWPKLELSHWAVICGCGK
jgi:hypothetical protein